MAETVHASVRRVEELRCPTHGVAPNVSVVQGPDGLKINADCCCDTLDQMATASFAVDAATID